MVFAATLAATIGNLSPPLSCPGKLSIRFARSNVLTYSPLVSPVITCKRYPAHPGGWGNRACFGMYLA